MLRIFERVERGYFDTELLEIEDSKLLHSGCISRGRSNGNPNASNSGRANCRLEGMVASEAKRCSTQRGFSSTVLTRDMTYHARSRFSKVDKHVLEIVETSVLKNDGFLESLDVLVIF